MKKILGLIVLLLCGVVWFWSLPSHLPFTPERWIETPWQKRYKLVESLKEQYQFKGMTEQEVEALLGEPDTVVKGSFEYKIKSDVVFDWRVFYLTFEDGRVVEYGTSVPDW